MNSNVTDKTSLRQEYGELIIATLLPNTTIQCTILCIGVIGNLLVLIMYCTKMNKEQTESRYFIPVLAVYDLLACVSATVYFVSETYMWISYRSDVLCKAVIFASGNTVITSTAFLVVIAIQRYRKICCPHSKQMTLFWRRLAVVFTILANLLYSAPSLVLSGVAELSLEYKNANISGTSCFTGTNKFPDL